MSTKVKVIIISVIGVILAGVLTVILLEGLNKKKFVITNNTDKNITALEVFFEDAEESDVVKIADIYSGSINAGSSVKDSFSPVKFGDYIGELAMLVTFDGQEQIFVYDGTFTGYFEGKIDIEFYQEDGKYWAKLNAATGIFKETKNTELKDSKLYFDFENNEWYYEDESADDFLDLDDFEFDEDDEELDDEEDDEDDDLQEDLDE